MLLKKGAGVLLAVLCLLMATEKLPAAGETAEELANQGFDAYRAGKYDAAAEAFSRFVTSYGESEEAQGPLKKMLPLLALSQIQLKQFDEAPETIQRALEFAAEIPPEIVEELRFWKAACELQAQQFGAARTSLEEFLENHPRSAKRAEVLLLVGTTYILEGQNEKAAAFFAQVREELNGFDRGRAVVMELHSLIQTGRLEQARQLLIAEYPRMGEILQLVSFQTLALELGSRFLEGKKYREAIACLQRVWRKDKLLEHQEARLQDLESRLKAAQERHADAYRQFQLKQMIAKLEREVKNFRETTQFDSALRLRLASAFMAMERYREAALIAEDMLAEMPPDEIVEQASGSLVRCWMEIGRWPKAIEATEIFEEKFPKSAQLPVLLFMRGQAQQSSRLYEESERTFLDVVERFPKDEVAPKALFMAGYSELLAENQAAVSTFDRLTEAYPKSPMVETARFWKGMARSFADQHEEARKIFADYLSTYGKSGRFVSDARFQQAYSAQALRDYDTSIRELRDFLRDFPDQEHASEALLLLGDALMAQGEIDEGIAVLRRIPRDDTKFYEEGWFKIGKALRLQEKVDELREHMEKFVRERGRSSRAAEAVYWIGWTWRQQGEDEKAREAYWDTIRKLGDDPAARGVEDLFLALPKYYPGDEGRASLSATLSRLTETADVAGKKTLAMRSLWANGRLLQKTDPTRSSFYMLAAAARIDPETASPMVMADTADGLRRGGKLAEAKKMYRDLLKWNPRAVQKDRAYAGLGLIAQVEGDEPAAIKYFDRFEKYAVDSPLLGEILLARGGLLRKHAEAEEAKAVFQQVLESDRTSPSEKARALYEMGDILMEQDNASRAVPYFQRIYVMYGRWRDVVAKAYLRSGEAFEKLDDHESAIRTYRELLAHEELASFAESQEAKKRLDMLGGQL